MGKFKLMFKLNLGKGMKISISNRDLKKLRKKKTKIVTTKNVLKDGGTHCSKCNSYFSFEDSIVILKGNVEKGYYKRFPLRCPRCLNILEMKKGGFWNRLEKENPKLIKEVREYLKIKEEI